LWGDATVPDSTKRKDFMKTKYLWIIFLVSIIAVMSGCDKKIEHQSTISVFGTGTVLAQPDVIQMHITLSNLAQTTKRAQ
jgi:uncharacterized protein YggE